MKSTLKKLLFIISVPFFYVINKLGLCYNHLYSDYVLRGLKSCGRGVCILPRATMAGKKYIEIGNNTFIGGGVVITAWDTYRESIFSPSIKIGANASIGEWNHITAINKIIIEDNVLTGRWVTISDNAHGNLHEDLNIHPSERNLYSKGSIKIAKNVWIGDKVTILSNVSIGEGAVIGANSVVTKDIPPYCVAAGIPAKIIREINGNK